MNMRKGDAGPKGSKGDTGAEGKPTSMVTMIALMLVVLLALGVAGYGVYQNGRTSDLANKTNELAKRNKIEVHRIAVLEKEAAASRALRSVKNTATAVLICQRLEELKTVIRHVVSPTRQELLRSSYYSKHPDLIQDAIDQGQRIAKRFAPKNCRKLPIVSAPAQK